MQKSNSYLTNLKYGRIDQEFILVQRKRIPKDWDVISLGDYAQVKGRIGWKGLKQSEYTSSGPFLIAGRHIKSPNVIWEKCDHISEERYQESLEIALQKNDVILSKDGSLGNPAIIRNLLGPATINSTMMLVRCNESKLSSEYFYQYLNGKEFKMLIYEKVSGSSIPHLFQRDMNTFVICTPCLEEQKRIALILSTWDKAIELKEKLIEEKKKQKSGLMQKLLTGKVRLPGFDGEWEYKKANLIFANISDKKHGGIGEVLSATQDSGILPRSEIGIDIKFEESSLSSYKRILKGDFVISLRSFQGGIEYSEYSGLVSPAYTVLRNKLDISHAFYKKFFKSTDFITRLNGLIYGIRDGKQIGYKDFSVLELPYPDSKEQKAIGEIIELADKEIKLHEKELEALKQQKKGLMQLLLTGIVRVNVETN